MAAPQQPAALTVQQVAELLCVNARTVYRLAARGALPGFKVGDAWRFLPDDIHKWIATEKARAVQVRSEENT